MKLNSCKNQTPKEVKGQVLLCLLILLSTSVLAQPTITSFTPLSGPVGTSVTMIGSGFNATPTNNTVYFGATKATVTAATSTQLTVTVPVGATYQPITVLTNGLIAYSKLPFATTYPSWGVIDSASFVSKKNFATGVNPFGVSAGDLDGDGKTDLAVLNLTGNTVSIFRNTSSGVGVASYAAKVDYATGQGPRSVLIGDVDSDGKADLVVPNFNSSTVSIFLNTSTAPGLVSFANKVDFATGQLPASVSIGDFDEDGKVDIVVMNMGSNTASVFRNTSPGSGLVSFATKVDYATGQSPYSVSIGDLDGDGKVDLAVVNSGSNTVSILRNTSIGAGSVSFAAKIDYSTGFNPTSISIGDFDVDGKLDMTIANSGDNTISILTNTSSGPGSVSFAAKIDYVTGSNPSSVFTGDLDGDGKVDLAVANVSSNSVSIFRNTSIGIGSISYADKVDYVTYATGTNPYSVVIADFDNDGKSDFAATNWNKNTVSVFLHHGGYLPLVIAGFTPANGPVGTSVTISGTGFSPTSADNIVYFGATKAAVTAATPTQLTVTVPVGATYQPISILVNGLLAYSKLPFVTTYPGWGVIDANSFTSPTNFAASSAGSVLVSDLDGDGKTDLIVNNYNIISVLRNITTNVGAVSYATKQDYGVGTSPSYVAIGDFDGDGKPDLVVPNAINNDNKVSIFRNTSSPGAISFSTNVDFVTGSYPESLAIGDFDGDGKADLAVAIPISNSVVILRNKSTGVGSISFAAKVNYATNQPPSLISAGDFDGDGKPDLAVVNSDQVSFFRNLSTKAGVISFGGNTNGIATGGASSSISIGDLDGDGKADLALTNSFGNCISILRNTSSGAGINFAANVDYGAGYRPGLLTIGDFDGDGKIDIAVSNSGSGTLSLFKNTGTGAGAISYEAKVDYAIAGNSGGISTGDLDGDGKSDLAVGASNGISVILHVRGVRPIITFAAIPQKTYGDAPFTLNATASTGLPITYNSSNTAVATISGNMVTITGAGTTTVTATQAGDSNNGTVSVSQVLEVGPFPAISDFTPSSGPVGTAVTINGTGFNATPSNNIIYFGATKATVTAATVTQLSVIVPVGATYQPISVLTNGLIAYSKLPFSTTYAGWGAIDSASFVSKTDFAGGTYPSSISVSDIDGDGKSDLVLANTGSNTISIFRNTSNGTGSASFAAKVDYATTSNPSSVSIGDLDGDGKPDLVVGNVNGFVSIFLNTSTGPGSVSFGARVDYQTSYSPINVIYSVSIADFDGDGRMDLVVGNCISNGSISVFRNTSTGAGSVSFAAKVDYAAGPSPYGLSIGDLDGDGRPDVVVANYTTSTFSIFRNTSTGMGSVSFASKIDFFAGSSRTPVSIGDLDGDGKLDLVAANFNSNILSIFRNTSTGAGQLSFAAQVNCTAASEYVSFSIGDLDGDGKPDLVVTSSGANSLSLFRNTSAGAGLVSFATKVDYSTGSLPYSVSIGDFDGDGKADLATANYESNTLSVILHKADQTITFSPLPTSLCYAAQSFTLTATASSGLPVTFNSNNTSVATINGNQLTIVGAGTATITANQVGNNNFAAASSPQTITVNPLPTAFNVTLQSPYCQGSSGATISLSGSENNTQYTLYYNGSALPPIVGNGSALTWSQLTQIGTYTAQATNTSSCTSSMNGSVNINLIPLPQASISGPSTLNSAPVTLTAPSGYSYTWSATGVGVVQQSSSPTLTVTAPGEYQVVVNFSGCTTTSSLHLVSRLANVYFNGTIAAASWRTDAAYATGNSDYKGLYFYSYDEKYQLQDAQFAIPDFTTHTFIPAGNSLHETGYTYDPNGNIQTLKRFDATGNKIHDLAYTYSYNLDPNKNDNKLQSVTNNGSAFRNYTYNPIGQMSAQDNSTGADQIVDYDVTGKVADVYSDASRSLKTTHYTYDDRGFRLSKVTYDNANNPQFTTWYIRDASGNVMSIYNQQANDTNITLEETPIYGSGKLGMYRPKSNGGGEYVYELTDHLGNVRATLKNDQTVYLATMEDNGATDYTNPRVSEMQYFTNLFQTQQHDARMNHTPPSAAVPSPANTSYLNWVNDGNTTTPKNIIGAGITLNVEAGDQLNLEAWAKYQHTATYSRDATPLMMAGLLATAFASFNSVEGVAQAAQDFTSDVPLALVATGADPATKPYAYLNYLVFDQNFVYKDGGAMRVPDAAGFDAGLEIAVQPQLVSFAQPIMIAESGYIYVWVSNESANTQVWWDDIKVTHSGNRVTQATDYYAFGSIMRTQSVPTELEYRFGYQGQYAEKDDETGWNHFELREFDGIIGRWTSMDPKRVGFSPYIGMGNNPIGNVDADGGAPWKPDENGNLVAEQGDNAYTLADYLDVTVDYAKQLLINQGHASNSKGILDLKIGDVIDLNNPYTRSIANSGSSFDTNALLTYMKTGVRTTSPTANDQYNCLGACLAGTKGIELEPGIELDNGGVFDAILSSDYSSTTLSKATFGKTILRLADENNNVQHGAVYYGTSKNGDVYVYTKNGYSARPAIMTLQDLQTKIPSYGTLQGIYTVNGTTPNR